MKGKYTVELFDKDTNKRTDVIESKNIVFSNTAQKYSFDHNYLTMFSSSSLHSQTGNSFYKFFKNTEYSAHYGTPLNMILTKKNEIASNDILNFSEDILAYAPRWNTTTSNYSATQGFLESATILHDRARYVFRFPDITANGSFNSIIMGPNMIDTSKMKLKNKYDKILTLEPSHINNATFVDEKVYESDNGKMNVYTISEYLLKKPPHLSKNCSVMKKLPAGGGSSYNDRKCVIYPFGDKYLYMAHPENIIYLLDSECNKLSELAFTAYTINMADKTSHPLYDKTTNTFFLTKSKKITLENNVVALVDLTEKDKLSPLYKIINSLQPAINGTGNDTFAYNGNKVWNHVNGKIYSLITGEEIDGEFLGNDNIIVNLTPYSSITYGFYLYYPYIAVKTQPYSYTLLDTPIIKTNDKFMRITYETVVSSDVFDEFEKIIGNSTASTQQNKARNNTNPLDINPPIDLHPDEPYGGLI